MGLRVRREVVREFWRLIRSGLSVDDAGAGIGVSRRVARRWVRKAGGVCPIALEAPQKPRHLTISEREQILVGLTKEHSVRQIARSIGRAPSTVLRELERNLHHQHYRRRAGLYGKAKPGTPITSEWKYSPDVAQRRADANAARPKTAKLAKNARLCGEVQKRLEHKHSPEQISCRLKKDFPDNSEMHVSHEAIYQSLFVQSRGGLRRELTKCLRTGRALRRPHHGPGERRGRIPDMVNISQRPASVEDRAVPGHWEGDLIVGKDSGSAIGTLVERTTRFTMLLHLPDGHGALAVQDAMIEAMARLPETLKQTLTWDQGKELTNHVHIADATGLDIYFCDPHSPWQRGTNENTNGLLRQYFPKGTDLSFHGPGIIENVARELNNRPRKTLDWDTPAEALDQLLSKATDPPGVAFTP